MLSFGIGDKLIARLAAISMAANVSPANGMEELFFLLHGFWALLRGGPEMPQLGCETRACNQHQSRYKQQLP